MPNRISRRRLLSGAAAALGAARLPWPERSSILHAREAMQTARSYEQEYEVAAKLASNENPYGPPDSVLKAMTGAFKYANRYGYPDGGIQYALATHHGVKPENILLGAGSGEILDVVGTAFARDGKKVVGVEPSYGSVYQHVTRVRGEAILLQLTKDYRQDVSSIVKAAKTHYRDVGFVYLCNPNNPTGLVVTKDEVRQLLDGLPEDVPVLIDEAYHHFVDDPNYATSIPYVLEGRPVIVARTFSKIAALAGMRLGYAVASKTMIDRIRPYSVGSINAVVKWGGAAALKDVEAQERVKRVTIDLREKTAASLRGLGYDVIPSQANFFMVHLRRPVQPVIEEFAKRSVWVGRPFPPMLQHLRVSVGTADEMSRFLDAFKQILPASPSSSGRG